MCKHLLHDLSVHTYEQFVTYAVQYNYLQYVSNTL